VSDLYLDSHALTTGKAGVAQGSSQRSGSGSGSDTERGIAAAAAAVPALSLEQRLEILASAAVAASSCTACRLAQGRNSVVFGAGNPQAALMFIGEGPGAEEDRQGLPFVGRAGELLTKIIEAIDLRRDEVYIGNIVKCRPPGNRDPEPDEIAACAGFLRQQIAAIGPRVLVLLGRIAAHALLGEGTPISKMRGHWTTVQGIATMVTFHPAALLRNPSLKRPVWEDMQQVRDRLRATK
jgi:DNA polymerase